MTSFADNLSNLFYRFAATGFLPASLFRKVNPNKVNKAKKTGILNLEIVCHCWQYSHFLTYQLSSLVKYQTDKFNITMTVFYAEEDEKVNRVLEYFDGYDLPSVTWNWRLLPKQSLLRRAIGRNMAAKETNADWIWFTDCDIIFHQGYLDALADELQARDDVLVFPRVGLGTTLMEDDNEVLQNAHKAPKLLSIPLSSFTPYGGERKKAKGPYQIVHGDIARACGYCPDINIYQKPTNRWRKTYEDRAFRWILGSQGVAVDVPNACQIRHLAKGRYNEASITSKIRMFNRKRQG